MTSFIIAGSPFLMAGVIALIVENNEKAGKALERLAERFGVDLNMEIEDE